MPLDGRSECTGVGIGRGYRSKATAISCQEPEILAFTNHSAPGPMWQPAQPTRACGERWKAVYSGSMTLWQAMPQNSSESM